MNEHMKLYDPLQKLELKGGNYMEYDAFSGVSLFNLIREAINSKLTSVRANPFYWSDPRNTEKILKQYKHHMNYYTRKAKGRYAVQWLGYNLTAISELFPNASAKIEADNGSLTLIEFGSSRCYYMQLQDWLVGPEGPGENITVQSDESFRNDYEKEKEKKYTESHLSGALRESPTGVKNPDMAPSYGPYLGDTNVTPSPSLHGGQVQGGNHLRH